MMNQVEELAHWKRTLKDIEKDKKGIKSQFQWNKY